MTLPRERENCVRSGDGGWEQSEIENEAKKRIQQIGTGGQNKDKVKVTYTRICPDEDGD